MLWRGGRPDCRGRRERDGGRGRERAMCRELYKKEISPKPLTRKEGGRLSWVFNNQWSSKAKVLEVEPAWSAVGGAVPLRRRTETWG